jgi:hypothetical protein
MREEDRLIYEDRDALIHEQRVEPRAGLFLLAGTFHVANYASRAEARLRERGALLVATVTFDGSAADQPSADAAGPRLADLAPVPARAYARQPPPPGRN